MIELFEDNIVLYKPEKEFYLRSLEYAKTLPTQDSQLDFHLFWKVPREFGRKQLAVLVSILVHHKNPKIHLWSNVDLSQKIVLEGITFHIWNYEEEKKNTILENLTFESDDLCYLEGDLFRLLVLYKYGGFYLDMDVLVLRDMSPLNHLEFLYQWGTSIIVNNNTAMNGAIMRFHKASKVLEEYL